MEIGCDKLCVTSCDKIWRKSQEVDNTVLPYYYKPKELVNMVLNPAGTNADRVVQFSASLGLIASDGGEPYTDKLKKDKSTNEKIALYIDRMEHIVTDVMRAKTVDQIENGISDISEEIKERLNREVFQKAFQLTEDNEIAIEVQEVLILRPVIQ